MIIVEEIAAVSLGLMKRSMSAFPLRESFSFLKGSSWVQKLCKVIYQSVQNLLLCFKTLNLSLTGRQWSNLPSRYLPLTSAWWGYWEMDQRYPWTDYPRYHLHLQKLNDKSISWFLRCLKSVLPKCRKTWGLQIPGFNGRTFFDSGLQIRKDAWRYISTCLFINILFFRI